MRKLIKIALVTLLIISIFATSIPLLTPAVSASDNWTLINDARGLKGYPNLQEYVWQKNATMPPNGQYDKIGLHRLVKTGTATKGVVFIEPGIYGSGEQLISNPPESNYTADESSSQAIYWANRGFEVYSIDWRTHFLPSTMNVSQASTIAGNWGWNQYINDMKEAVDKTKELTGSPKIFLAGISLGGQVAMYYASEYWKQDLRGLILLDGTENPIKFTNVTNSYNVTLALSTLSKIGGLAWETPRRSLTDIPPSGMLFAYQIALQNPGAPAEWPPGTPLQPIVNPLTNKIWANITEYIAYQMYSTNYSNLYGGYGNITVIVQWRANGDRYFPVRLGVESNAIHDWNNCPYVSFDFDDHYKEIDVPLLAVRSELWGIPTYGNITNGMATADFTQIIVPKYGHLDIFTGPYSAKDVSQPTLDWMLSHYQRPTALAKLQDSSLTTGQTTTITTTTSGGIPPFTYQWYEGTTALPGETNPQLIVTKTTSGTYTYFCSILDSEKTTEKSNTVTLSVALPPTPTSSPTASPTTVPTTISTATPSPGPTLSNSPQPSPLPIQTSPMLTLIVVAVGLMIFVIIAVILVIRKRAK